MKTADFLRQHDACRDVAKWALSISDDMADVWDALIEQGKHDWIVWAATRPGVFPSSTLRKLACRFVRETPLADGMVVWDLLTGERSRSAVEAYADGKATKKELADARNASRAARAAYNAVYTAAYSAAYAAYVAAYISALAATYAAANADADADAAEAAQIRMIAELGNPFREENDND